MDRQNLRVKICGITQPEQGRAIAAAGATMLGFICVPQSPRFVTPAQIAQIVAALPTQQSTTTGGCDRVGVFVNASLDVIQETVTMAHLNGVQLHGNESIEFCQEVKRRLPSVELIKALRIRSAIDLAQADYYQAWVDTFLLDAYHPTLAGGTGQPLNWQDLQPFRPAIPWLLAGGLTPDNVLVALNQLQSAGIDLSSGVETSPGIKDMAKVAQLFQALNHIRLVDVIQKIG